MNDDLSPFKVVIPARFGSTRFPGKPLELLGAKTILQHVVEHAQASGAEEVVVAVDDERIRDEVNNFGGRAVMTDSGHRSGTDRIGEVASIEGWGPETIVVNLQGDEPFVPASLIDTVARTLMGASQAGVATLARPLDSVREVLNPNVVKVVIDHSGRALYFSRAPIPFPRDHALAEHDAVPSEIPYFGHLGIYAYRVKALQRLCVADASALEKAESLEQLRALHHGIDIQVHVVEADLGPGIDTPEDLQRARELIANER